MSKYVGGGVRVCHVTTVHPLGDARILHKECQCLVEAGYDVHLVVCHSHDDIMCGVHVHALAHPPNRRLRTLKWPWLAYRKILSLQPRPAIVHMHDPELLLIGQALRMHGMKVIFDVHENIREDILHKEYLSPLAKRIFSSVYWGIEKILTRGLATVHVLESIAVRYRQPRAVVRNLPKLDAFPAAQAGASAGGPTQLIYVGSVSYDRGAVTMAKLAAELDRRGLDFQMRVIGAFDDEQVRNEVQSIISQNNLQAKVMLLPRMEYGLAMQQIARSDIGLCLLQPTPSFKNSLASKILEYLAAGVPVVASDFECWRPFVSAIGAGLQVDVANLSQIADNVQWMIENPGQRQEMGRRGMHAAHSEWCWQQEKNRLLEFYEFLLGREAGSGESANKMQAAQRRLGEPLLQRQVLQSQGPGAEDASVQTQSANG